MTKYFVEIQVRTIFEEAWSEVDHTIRYPYDQNNPVFAQFLLILNRLAGSADEMGTFVKFLQREMDMRERLHYEKISEKDKKISELQAQVKKLNLKENEVKIISEGLENLKIDDFKFLNYKPLEFKVDNEPIKLDLSWLEDIDWTKIIIPNHSDKLNKKK